MSDNSRVHLTTHQLDALVEQSNYVHGSLYVVSVNADQLVPHPFLPVPIPCNRRTCASAKPRN